MGTATSAGTGMLMVNTIPSPATVMVASAPSGATRRSATAAHISSDQAIVINDGTVKVVTSGKTYTYSSSLDSKPKGIKADGNLQINGGAIKIGSCEGNQLLPLLDCQQCTGEKQQEERQEQGQ